MKMKKYPYSGYTISWNFYSFDAVYEDYFFSKEVNENVYNDLFEVLRILDTEKLFYPTKIFLDNGILELNGKCIKEIILEIKKSVEAGVIKAEISRIQGKSLLYNNDKEEIIEDLLTIDSFRFFERQFTISTSKSVWIPISIDLEHSYKWQPILCKSNGPRLEKALKKIYDVLSLKVEPSPEELNKEFPIWQFGFKLYPSIKVLKNEYNKNKLNHSFFMDNYIEEFQKIIDTVLPQKS